MPNYQEGGNEGTCHITRRMGGGGMRAHVTLPRGGNETTCQITRKGAMRAHATLTGEWGGALRAHVTLPRGGNETTCQITRKGAMRAHATFQMRLLDCQRI